MKNLVVRVAVACKSLMGLAGSGPAVRPRTQQAVPLNGVAEHIKLPPEGAEQGSSENLVPSVQVRLSPMMTLFARSPSPTISLPLESGRPRTLEQVLRQLEQQAPEAFLQPGTRKLRRHVRVYLNRQAGVSLDRQVSAGDVIEIEMQAIGGG